MITVLSDYWDELAWERSGLNAKLTAAEVKNTHSVNLHSP
jgi:hypothetical protein